jgi:hypothetical protein
MRLILAIVLVFSLVIGCDADLALVYSPKKAIAAAIGKDGPSSIQTILKDIKEDRARIFNSALDYDERVRSINHYILCINDFLRTRDSSGYSDVQLQELLHDTVVSKSEKFDGRDFNLRIVNCNFLSTGLVGSLKSNWTIVQWWDSEQVKSQILLERNPLIAVNSSVFKVEGKPILILYGPSTVYFPRPIELSAWQLVDEHWEQAEIFDKMISNDVLKCSIYENDMLVESYSKPEEIAVKDSDDGIIIYCENNPQKRISIRPVGGKLVAEYATELATHL